MKSNALLRLIERQKAIKRLRKPNQTEIKKSHYAIIFFAYLTCFSAF